MLLTIFVKNNTTRKYSINFFKFWYENSITKVHNLHHCRKFVQIICQKGAGTKLHKCLLFYSWVPHTHFHIQAKLRVNPEAYMYTVQHIFFIRSRLNIYNGVDFCFFPARNIWITSKKIFVQSTEMEDSFSARMYN